MKSHLRLTISLLLIITAVTTAGIGQKFSGYHHIEATDAGAMLAADWVTKERSEKTGHTVTLVSIAKAESADGKGSSMKYRLCMNLTDNGRRRSARAVITRDQYSNHSLISWVRASCK